MIPSAIGSLFYGFSRKPKAETFYEIFTFVFETKIIL